MPLLLKSAWLQRLDYPNRRTEAHSIRTRLAMYRSMEDPLGGRDAVVCPALFCCQGRRGWINQAGRGCLFDRSLSACVLIGGTQTQRPQLFLLFSTTSICSFWWFSLSLFFFLLIFVWQGWPVVKAGLDYLYCTMRRCCQREPYARRKMGWKWLYEQLWERTNTKQVMDFP